MRKILNIYFRVLQVLITILMFLLLVPVSLQVFSRYVGFIPRYIWTEEMARFAFIWIIMIGSIIAVHDGTHFNIDIFPNMSSRMKRVMDLLFIFVMLIAAAVFIIGGYKFAQFGAIQQSELAGLPMLTIYIAWPLAGVSWMLFLVEHLVDHFTGFERRENDGSV